MNIILVDDHKLFRIGLREIFQKGRMHKVTTEFSSASEMLTHYSGVNDHLVLLDINLESENGLDFVHELKLKFPHLKAAILTMHKEVDIIKDAVSKGVVGYFNKDINSEELHFGLQKIEDGGRYFTSQVTDALLQPGTPNISQTKFRSLTEREKQVLQFLIDGYTSKEIAERMKIGKRTVDAHRAHILEKLKFRSTPLLIKHIVENKLL